MRLAAHPMSVELPEEDLGCHWHFLRTGLPNDYEEAWGSPGRKDGLAMACPPGSWTGNLVPCVTLRGGVVQEEVMGGPPFSWEWVSRLIR